MVLHFDVGRRKSVEAVRTAMQSGQKIFLVCQKDASIDEPDMDEMFDIGVICTIRQTSRIPNTDNLRVVVEGTARGALMSLTQTKPFLNGVINVISDTVSSVNADEERAYQRAVKREFENILKLVHILYFTAIAEAS